MKINEKFCDADCRYDGGTSACVLRERGQPSGSDI